MKQLKVTDGVMDYYDPAGSQIIARQQMGTVYHRNGIAYALRRECLLGQRTIKGARSGALIIEGDHVSIDTEWDFKLVEFVLAHLDEAR